MSSTVWTSQFSISPASSFWTEPNFPAKGLRPLEQNRAVAAKKEPFIISLLNKNCTFQAGDQIWHWPHQRNLAEICQLRKATFSSTLFKVRNVNLGQFCQINASTGLQMKPFWPPQFMGGGKIDQIMRRAKEKLRPSNEINALHGGQDSFTFLGWIMTFAHFS